MSDDVDEAPRAPLVEAAEAAFRRAHADHLEAATAKGNENLTAWLEAFEGEHATVLRDGLAEIVAHPDTPQVVRDILGGIIAPEHQTQVLLGVAAVYALVSAMVGAVVAPMTTEVAAAAFKLKPTMPLSPAEMAAGVNRGWVGQGAAATEASLSGVNHERFDLLVNLSGRPPGLDQLMEAYRRGIIGADRFEHGVRESDVRVEWNDVLFALRYAPVGAGTVVQGAVQGHLSKAEAAGRIKQAGIDPDNFEWLFETAGRPPGIHELAELLNRGEISQGVLEQAIRESDIKDKYISEIVKLRRKIPPMRTVVAAVHQNVLSEAEAVRKLQQLGYNHEDAAMLAKEGTNLKHAVNKALSQSQIHQLYASRLIDRAKATKMLGDLGYDTTEIGFILALADHERQVKAQQTAINRVHTRYVAYRLTRTEAIHALGQIGIDTHGRDDLLGAWDDERAANAPTYTLAQIQGAAHRELIDQPRFLAEIVKLGYPAGDASLLWHLAWPPNKAVPPWTGKH